MKKNLTEIVFILDKSGSMGGLESDTIGGFNSMLEKQKKENGEAFVSTVLFSNESETIHDRINIKDVSKLTDEQYYVGGCTALLDAIGGAIKHISDIHKYVRKSDVPNRTIFIITTDGLENASHKYNINQIKKMIEEKKKENWEFLFLGANIDAIATARNFGISEDRAVNFKSDKRGTKLNYSAMCKAISSVRNDEELGAGWKAEIEEDYKNRK